MSNEALIEEANWFLPCTKRVSDDSGRAWRLIGALVNALEAEAAALEAAERKPVIDREALVEFFKWHPDPNSVADHFMWSFSIEDKREAQAEAWDASRDAWGRWLGDLHRHDVDHTPPVNPYRATEIREGRA